MYVYFLFLRSKVVRPKCFIQHCLTFVQYSQKCIHTIAFVTLSLPLPSSLLKGGVSYSMNQLLRNWDKNNGWVGEHSAGSWLSPFHPSPWYLRRKLNYCVFKIMRDVHECYILNCIIVSFYLFYFRLPLATPSCYLNEWHVFILTFEWEKSSPWDVSRGVIVSLYTTQNKRDSRKHCVTGIYIYLTLPAILNNNNYYYYCYCYYYYYYVQVSQYVCVFAVLNREIY